MATMDPQLAAILAYLPPYPGTRAIPLNDLRAFIRQTAEASPKYPASLSEVRDLSITGPDGDPLALRAYVPEGKGPWPVTVYYHGGGFVMGDLDSEDMITRALAEAGQTIVLSVDYRLAPEHPHPAAAQDAYVALDWAHKNAASLGGDPQRLAVAGGSAGGVLAALAAIYARDYGIPLRAQLLFYGSGGCPFERLPSWHEFKDGALLNVDDIDYFWELYLGDTEARGRSADSAPRFADLKGVAPAYVLSAEMDPTRDDAEDYGQRIIAAGGEVKIDRAKGVVHGFLSFLGTVDEAKHSIDRVAEWLRPRWQA